MRKFGFVKNLKTQSIMFGAILALIVVFIVMVTRTIRRNRDDKKLR